MRLVKRLPLFALASALSLAAVACGGGGDDDVGGQPPVDPAGTNTQYVMDVITLPTSTAEADRLGLNIDGDEQGRPDNALGSILSAVASQGGNIDLQASIDEQVQDGSIILLANLKATSTSMAAGAGMWVFLGDSATVMPAACTDPLDLNTCGKHLDGNGQFTLDPQSPKDALITGPIIGGKFNGGPGKITIDVSLGGSGSIRMNLIGARIEVGSVTADGLASGKLGGAITKDELDNNVLPAMADVLQGTVDDDCTGVSEGTCPGQTCKPCGCMDGSGGRTMLDLFDDDDSCNIDTAELMASSLISSLLAPDVDLLDDNGNFNPRKDGVKDALSIGLGFSGVNATFTNPANVDAPQ